MKMLATWRIAALAAAVLAACGDGDNGGSVPPPAAESITLSGTAARGAALAAAAVGVKCASGTPAAVSATTAGSGAYSVTLEGAGLPCVLRVTGAGGEVYHSVVAGSASSGSFVANISPLTELMVAQLAGSAPAAFYDGFGSGAAVSAAALSQAVAYVKSAISKVADWGSMNPATDALVVGNALDQVIEATVTGLAAAGVSLASATQAIAANPAAPTVLASALAPQAAACAWLKSGSYRFVDPFDAESPPQMSGLFQVNAAGLGGVDPDGKPFTMTSDGGCQFSLVETDFVTRLLVASSGVIVIQGESLVDTERNFALAIPEQTLPLSEFAGTWNAVSWAPLSAAPGAGWIGTVHEGTIDAGGQITALSDCVGLAPCVPESGQRSHLVVNPAGGFDEILPDGSTWSRVFLYKDLAGRRMAVWITPERQFIVAVPKAAQSLPVAGLVTDFREVVLRGNGLIDTARSDSSTVTGVDAATKTVARIRASNNLADSQRYDTPRDGVRYRAANTCAIGGTAVPCGESVALPAQGMGFTVTTSVASDPAATFFGLSVAKPPQ